MFERFRKNLEQVTEGLEKRKLLEVPLSSEQSLVAKRELRSRFILNFLPFIKADVSLMFVNPLSFFIKNKRDGTDVSMQELVAGKDFPEAASKKIFFTDIERFGVNVEKNIVGVDMEALRDPRHIFVLLHEIGHLAAQGHLKNDRVALRAYHNRLMESGNPIKLMPAEHKIILQEERDAWAKAIRIARRLKQTHGINLFDLFKNTDDFLNWLRVAGLRSYECRAEIFGNTKAFTRSQPIKKWKEENREIIEGLFKANTYTRDVEKYATIFEESPEIKEEVRLLMKQSRMTGHKPSKKDVDEIIDNVRRAINEPETK